MKIPVEFSLEVLAAGESAVCECAQDAPECGIRLDGVKLESRAYQVYFAVTFTVTDEEALWFMLCDANGEALPKGADASGIVMCVSGEEGKAGTVYCQIGTIDVDEMPGTVLNAHLFW